MSRLAKIIAAIGGVSMLPEDAEASYRTKLMKAFSKPKSTKYWSKYNMDELNIKNVELIPGNSGHGTLKIKFKDGREAELSGIQSSPGSDEGNAISGVMRDIRNGIKYDAVGADTTNAGNRFKFTNTNRSVPAAMAVPAPGLLQAGEGEGDMSNMEREMFPQQYDNLLQAGTNLDQTQVDLNPNASDESNEYYLNESRKDLEANMLGAPIGVAEGVLGGLGEVTGLGKGIYNAATGGNFFDGWDKTYFPDIDDVREHVSDPLLAKTDTGQNIIDRGTDGRDAGTIASPFPFIKGIL